VLREWNDTPHVAQNDTLRSSVIDRCTTLHPGYGQSQAIRKRIEGYFGWLKTVGGFRKSRFIGRAKPDFQFVLTMATYNLVRIRNLEELFMRIVRGIRVPEIQVLGENG